MPIEISYLISALALYGLMIVVQVIFSNLEHKLTVLAGARDGIMDKNTKTLRAKRANQNMIEALAIFVPLVLCAAYLDRFNALTALGAALFFWGRVAYAPLYWLGVPWLRTLAWAISLVGSLMVFFQILPFTSEVVS